MDAKQLLDGMDIGAVAIGPDWTITAWSAPAARITGIPASQALGKGFWIAFPSAEGTPVERLLQEVLRDGAPRTWVLPGPAGASGARVIEVTASRAPNRSHLILALRAVPSDVAPESRAADILRAFEQERRFYRRLFDALPTPALVLGIDGQILEANPAATELLGAEAADALRGRLLGDWTLASLRPALGSALRDAARQPQRFRLAIEFAGEAARDVDAAALVLDPGGVEGAGGAPRLLFLAVDVTHEVLLQRKLMRSDRLSQLGALVSGVAHELNNPLAAIAAFAELLSGDVGDPRLKESADVIHAEAIRAGRVVQNLLDFARQRPHARVAVDVKDVIDRALALQRNALKRARSQVVVTIPDHIPAVLGDPQELQQVLLNGIVNAIQAIEAGGRSGKVIVSAQRSDRFVTLTVEDTGPGVPPSVIERVFDPFFTTKGEAATGLGLSISQGLVRGMGGRLWIQNVDGGGARLVIELPADEGTIAPAPVAAPARERRPLEVLVVEDESSVRRAMVRLLERLGHHPTGVEGLAEARARLGDATAFDAMVVDVHLDESHTGFELFDTLREEGRGRERRIIFTTGDSISQGTRDALARAERPVLKKPFRLEDLRDVIDRVATARPA